MGVPGDSVIAHLESAYGVPITGLAALDRDVWRADRADGSTWVVRIFPPQRPVAAVEEDAVILDRLEAAGFPAERRVGPVSTLDGRGVLVTGFVVGEDSQRPGTTFAVLGGLLGSLHQRLAHGVRAGGAWHHLAPTGGPEEEVGAALALLQTTLASSSGADEARCAMLLDAVAGIDDAADLPHAFVHPDFVPANAIQVGERSLVMVDWAGAGRGPRLWSLAFLLWAGGVLDLRLVDVAVSRYRRHVQPTQDELDRLAGVLWARPVLIECWSVAAGRRSLAEAVASLRWAQRQAARIAERAVERFHAPAEQ
ncbi:MAG TPA: phosphotransferase [Micromonosporaceae bacterium]